MAANTVLTGDVGPLPTAEVRQLPCAIHFRGRADVAQRFDTYLEEKDLNGEAVIEGYFRGHPLVGARIDVPENYKGVVFSATTTDETTTLKAKASFDRLTYFNWTTKPSPGDPQQAVQDWISVAQAIHVDPPETGTQKDQDNVHS